MMKKCRVGLVGLGSVAQICHLPAYINAKNIEVAAGAEIRKEVLQQVSADWGFKGYSNYEEMLDKEKLDIVCILTGPRISRRIAEHAAECKINVFVEKPMALSLEDARAIIDTCKGEKVKLFYGETYRFFPTVKKAAEMIKEGYLGDIHLLLETLIGGTGEEHFECCDIYPPGAPGAGGWGLTDHGIHLVDTFRWLTKSDVDWVFGRGLRAGHKPETEFLTLQLKNGAIGQLIYNEATFHSDMPYEGMFSWGSYGAKGVSRWESYPGNFRIHGSRGALRVFLFPNKMYYFSKEKVEEIGIEDFPFPAPWGLQIESFADSILNDTEPEITGIDGFKALQVILAAYESFETKKIVEINPPLK